MVTEHSKILRGRIFHSRPAHKEKAKMPANQFSYPIFSMLLDIKNEGDFQKYFKKSWFFKILTRDYLENTSGSLLENLKEFIKKYNLKDQSGNAFQADQAYRIYLQTMPRTFGYMFNPVSFWYFLSGEDKLVAVLAEVNNTFGERHFYWTLNQENSGRLRKRSEKVFHVSPFFPREGFYDFDFQYQLAAAKPKIKSIINYFNKSDELLLATWIEGTPSPLTQKSLRALFFKYGLLSMLVISRIHWQALILWLKKAQFYRKPDPGKPTITF